MEAFTSGSSNERRVGIAPLLHYPRAVPGSRSLLLIGKIADTEDVLYYHTRYVKEPDDVRRTREGAIFTRTCRMCQEPSNCRFRPLL